MHSSKPANGEPAPPLRPQLLLCTAHVSHNFARLLREHIKDKPIRTSYMWLLTRLMNCDNMDDISEQFRNLCRLALSHEPVEDIEAELLAI